MQVEKERKVEVFTHINKEKSKKIRNKNKNI
jgi:hypothetical protein